MRLRLGLDGVKGCRMSTGNSRELVDAVKAPSVLRHDADYGPRGDDAPVVKPNEIGVGMDGTAQENPVPPFVIQLSPGFLLDKPKNNFAKFTETIAKFLAMVLPIGRLP